MQENQVAYVRSEMERPLAAQGVKERALQGHAVGQPQNRLLAHGLDAAEGAGDPALHRLGRPQAASADLKAKNAIEALPLRLWQLRDQRRQLSNHGHCERRLHI